MAYSRSLVDVRAGTASERRARAFLVNGCPLMIHLYYTLEIDRWKDELVCNLKSNLNCDSGILSPEQKNAILEGFTRVKSYLNNVDWGDRFATVGTKLPPIEEGLSVTKL